MLRRPKSQRGSLNLNFMGYRTFSLLKVSVLMGIYRYGGCREIRLARISGLLIMKFVVNDSTAFAVFFLFGLKGCFGLSKICAFLGNDYDFMRGRKRERRPDYALKEKIKEQIINLINNENVTKFLVGEIGGFETDAYDAVLEVQKSFPQIKIILVISQITELNEINRIAPDLIREKRGFDEFILPDKCATGYKKLGIVYRNRYIIEHTDFIIAYNRWHGKAYDFCKQAESKRVKVIELAKE